MHVRCPNCHIPLEVVEEESLQDLTCPSCGSSFNLLGREQEDGDTTASFRPGPLKKIAHFELIESLGQGQFGSVFKARDTELDRTVAVKIPRRDQLGPGEAEQFLREARAAAQLKHPNIVGVHEVGRDNETIYIVSDIIEGVDLAEWLTGSQPTLREAAQLCAKIAVALQHAHEAGVVHRDLKPSNIMMDKDGEPHIMDFGLAKREAGEITMTLEGKILGTPAYMSPEQAQGDAHQADGRSDVYSLGVILFELLTGERPFRGTTRMLLHQVINEDAPSPRKLSANVPCDLETICLCCLEKDPARRFQTADELATELDRFLCGHAILSRPIGRIARTSRWCRRNPVVASLLTLVAITLLAGITISLAYANKAHTNEQIAKRRTAETVEALDAATRAQTATQAANAKTELEVDRALIQRAIALSSEKKAQEAELQTRRSLYQAHMHLANDAAQLGNRGRVMELLDLYLPKANQEDLRGFEWYYLWRQSRSYVFSRWGGHHAHDLHFTPDGERLLIGNQDGRGRLYPSSWMLDLSWKSNNWRTTKPDVDLFDRDFVDGVRYLSLFPDGKRMAAVTVEDEVCVYNFATQELLFTCQGEPQKYWDLYLSADGKRLAALAKTPEYTLFTWNAENGERGLAKQLKHEALSLAIAADGDRIAIGGNQSVYLYDGSNGDLLTRLEHEDSFYNSAVKFSPDGELVAAGSRKGFVSVWNVSDGVKLKTWNDRPGTVSDIHFSPDGQYLTTSGYGDSKVVVRETSSWKIVRTLLAAPPGVRSTAFSKDQSMLAAGGHPTICIWDLDQLPVDASVGDVRGIDVDCLTFSPNGKILAVTGSNRILLFDPNKEKVDKEFETQAPRCLAFSPDSEMLAVGTGRDTIELWNPATTSKVDELIRAESGEEASQIKSIAFSPQGKHLAASFMPFKNNPQEAFVVVWERESSKETHRFIVPPTSGNLDHSHPGQVCFHPDGMELICQTSGETTLIWNLESGKLLRTLEGSRRNASAIMALSPTGEVQANQTVSSYLPSIYLRDLKTGERLREMHGHAGEIHCLSYSPDGKLIASGSADKTVRIWDAETGQERITLRGHEYGVQAVAFSPDGNLVVSADRNSLHWWRRASKREVVSRYLAADQKSQAKSIAFSPDGKTLAIGRDNGKIKLWDIAAQQMRAEIRAHSTRVLSLTFSPDGKLLVSGALHDENDPSQTVRIWNGETSEHVATLKGPGETCYHAAISSDGKWLATARHTHHVNLWDLPSRKLLKTIPGQLLAAFSTTADGQWLATALAKRDKTSPEVVIRHIPSGRVEARLTGHTDTIRSIDYSPDGKKLSTTSRDGSLRVWDIASQRQTHQRDAFPYVARQKQDSFSPDSKTLYWLTPENSVRKLDLGGEDKNDPLIAENVNRISLSPDGKLLATIARRGGAVSIVSVETNEIACVVDDTKIADDYRIYFPNELQESSDFGQQHQIEALKAKRRLWSVRFSPDGKTLAATGNDGRIRLWDVEKKSLLSKLPAHDLPAMATLSPNGKLILSAGHDGKVQSWSLETRDHINTVQASDKLFLILAVSPDGKTLTTAGTDHLVHIWNLPDLTSRAKLEGHQHDIDGIAYSSDSRLLATLDKGGTLNIWDASDHRLLESYDAMGQHRCLFTPDDSAVITTSWSANPKAPESMPMARKLGSGELMELPGDMLAACQIAYSPDGKLAATGHSDGSIRLWDATTLRLRKTLPMTHLYRVDAMHFARDGKTLATADAAGFIKLWSVPDGEFLGRLVED